MWVLVLALVVVSIALGAIVTYAASRCKSSNIDTRPMLQPVPQVVNFAAPPAPTLLQNRSMFRCRPFFPLAESPPADQHSNDA